MSRIGRLPVQILKGVEVRQSNGTLSVKGPKGELTLDVHPNVKVVVDDSEIRVERFSDEKPHRALHGLTRSLIANMVKGVTQGFTKELQLVGVGYRASTDGKTLVLALGYSHEVRFPAPEGITLTTPAQDRVVVSGTDKQLVGQVAANIRELRPPEPYKGKGIRYMNEQIRRKVGKAGA